MFFFFSGWPPFSWALKTVSFSGNCTRLRVGNKVVIVSFGSRADQQLQKGFFMTEVIFPPFLI